ncbi:MAG: glycoside hydrolase family 43 protein [Clostridia bacterium]|nr:glycoside hydrolase family 43 protein [Clostridia bacterium]
MQTEGYLFVHFTDHQSDGAMNEQVYFSLSEDGLSWQALNKKRPVLVSGVGEQGARDPFLIRGMKGDGFYIIATDLSMHHRRHNWGGAIKNGSRSILVWKSEDLVNWQGPELKTIAPADAGCAWAPEAVYDSGRGEYLVFWASFTQGKHKIYSAYTPDFDSFSEPKLFIERECDVIDTDICEENGTYYRFSKDETEKSIIMETSTSLTGDFRQVDSTLSKILGVEGPECFKLKDGRWCILLDEFMAGNGYHPYITDCLSSGNFVKDDNVFSTQMQLRHGGVLPITAIEKERLRNAYAL